jgi:hypothetical protein
MVIFPERNMRNPMPESRNITRTCWARVRDICMVWDLSKGGRDLTRIAPVRAKVL